MDMTWSVSLDNMQEHDVTMYGEIVKDLHDGKKLSAYIKSMMVLMELKVTRGCDQEARMLAVLLAAYEAFKKGEQDDADNRKTGNC